MVTLIVDDEKGHAPKVDPLKHIAEISEALMVLQYGNQQRALDRSRHAAEAAPPVAQHFLHLGLIAVLGLGIFELAPVVLNVFEPEIDG